MGVKKYVVSKKYPDSCGHSLEPIKRSHAVQPTEAAIPPSCLVIADRQCQSDRYLSIGYIGMKSISRAKKGSVGNTQLLPRAKMLLFPMSFSALEGLVLNEKM